MNDERPDKSDEARQILMAILAQVSQVAQTNVELIKTNTALVTQAIALRARLSSFEAQLQFCQRQIQELSLVLEDKVPDASIGPMIGKSLVQGALGAMGLPQPQQFQGPPMWRRRTR